MWWEIIFGDTVRLVKFQSWELIVYSFTLLLSFSSLIWSLKVCKWKWKCYLQIMVKIFSTYQAQGNCNTEPAVFSLSTEKYGEWTSNSLIQLLISTAFHIIRGDFCSSIPPIPNYHNAKTSNCAYPYLTRIFHFLFSLLKCKYPIVEERGRTHSKAAKWECDRMWAESNPGPRHTNAKMLTVWLPPVGADQVVCEWSSWRKSKSHGLNPPPSDCRVERAAGTSDIQDCGLSSSRGLFATIEFSKTKL